MFKLVVLFALAAVAFARPSGIPYATHVVAAVPAAVSHQSRVDVIKSQPLIYTAPVVQKTYLAAPVVAPAVLPAAVSHTSRVDVHSSPVIATYAAAAPLVHSVPVVHSAPAAWPSPLVHAAPYAYGYGW